MEKNWRPYDEVEKVAKEKYEEYVSQIKFAIQMMNEDEINPVDTSNMSFTIDDVISWICDNEWSEFLCDVPYEDLEELDKHELAWLLSFLRFSFNDLSFARKEKQPFNVDEYNTTVEYMRRIYELLDYPIPPSLCCIEKEKN